MSRAEDARGRRRFLSPRFVAGKVRQHGVVWCFRVFSQRVRGRAGRRVRTIESGVSGRVRPLQAALWHLHDNMHQRDGKQPDVLYAFYDLAVSPATFDIVTFLVLAELERKKAGCRAMHVVIVPGTNEGFHEGGSPYGAEEKRWRLRNVLVPCCWLIPACQQVTVCTSREEARVFEASLVSCAYPWGYTVRFPKDGYTLRTVVTTSRETDLPSIHATSEAVRLLGDWINSTSGGRKVVTITLRECSYERDRNSDLEAWGAFARGLDSTLFFPVVLRDTETAFEASPSSLDGLRVFPEVVWNIELRAALYELSYLNLFMINGPATLCIFNQRARCISFQMITPSCGATTEAHFRSAGLEPGSQFPWATPLQRIVWEADRLEVIEAAFGEMCERIEGTSAEAPRVSGVMERS